MSILFLVASFVLLFAVVRLLIKTPKTPPPTRPKRVASSQMLRCSHCGLHVPENEAVREGTRIFCSAEHRDTALSLQSTRD